MIKRKSMFDFSDFFVLIFYFKFYATGPWNAGKVMFNTSFNVGRNLGPNLTRVHGHDIPLGSYTGYKMKCPLIF